MREFLFEITKDLSDDTDEVRQRMKKFQCVLTVQGQEQWPHYDKMYRSFAKSPVSRRKLKQYCHVDKDSVKNYKILFVTIFCASGVNTDDEHKQSVIDATFPGYGKESWKKGTSRWTTV